MEHHITYKTIVYIYSIKYSTFLPLPNHGIDLTRYNASPSHVSAECPPPPGKRVRGGCIEKEKQECKYLRKRDQLVEDGLRGAPPLFHPHYFRVFLHLHCRISATIFSLT